MIKHTITITTERLKPWRFGDYLFVGLSLAALVSLVCAYLAIRSGTTPAAWRALLLVVTLLILMGLTPVSRLGK